MKKLLKGIVTLVSLLLVGVLSVIDIAMEIMYQLVKAIRKGYKYMVTSYINMIASLCKDDKTWDKLFSKLKVEKAA